MAACPAPPRGHDFRPAYRLLAAVRRELPCLPIMALTATATPRVQDDIVQQLRLRDPLLLRASFNRPNIAFEGEAGAPGGAGESVEV